MRSPKVYFRYLRKDWNRNGWEPTDTGWLLTISIVVLVESIALPVRCADGQCSSKLEDIFKLKPSEMGDTLAGMFSALAFIWIIVTVFLQSRELREQRKEFRDQRIATESMAKAMSAQAEIFEDERNFRQESRAKSQLEELLISLEFAMKRANTERWTVEVPKRFNISEKRAFENALARGDLNRAEAMQKPDVKRVDRVIFEKNVDREQNFRQAQAKIDGLRHVLSNVDPATWKDKPSKSGFERLLAVLYSIGEVEKSVARDQRIRIDNLNLPELHKSVESLLAEDVWKVTRGEREAKP